MRLASHLCLSFLLMICAVCTYSLPLSATNKHPSQEKKVATPKNANNSGKMTASDKAKKLQAVKEEAILNTLIKDRRNAIRNREVQRKEISKAVSSSSSKNIGKCSEIIVPSVY